VSTVKVDEPRMLTAALVQAAVAAGRPALDEAAAKQVLAAYGVAVPAGGLAGSAAEAVKLAAGLGGPVVMKAVGALIQHKTESRLVVLDLRSADEVAEAYEGLAARAGDALEAVLVEEMVCGSREFMVGMKRDIAFGAVVAFGLGGTMTEVFHDIVLAIPPVTEGDAAELFDIIRGTKLLGDFRGQPAVDRDKLAAVVMAVASIAANHPQIAEIDEPRLHVGSGGSAGPSFTGHRRRLGRRVPLGRVRASQHHRRRVFGRHLSGEPPRRRILRSARLRES
jgi:hypothetical protein